MSQEYLIRPTQWLIAPAHDPRVFHDLAYVVAIDDEGAGEYVRVKEHDGSGDRQISLDPERWPDIKQAVELAITEIKVHAREQDND